MCRQLHVGGASTSFRQHASATSAVRATPVPWRHVDPREGSQRRQPSVLESWPNGVVPLRLADSDRIGLHLATTDHGGLVSRCSLDYHLERNMATEDDMAQLSQTKGSQKSPGRAGIPDAAIRPALRERLLRRHATDADTVLIEELGLCRGKVRVDLALVNGSLHGFEIKSDRDSLRRLSAQVGLYS